MLSLTPVGNDRLRFAVHVQPRAARSEVVGVHGDALKVRVQAPPVDGAANEALVACLASVLGVGRGEVTVQSGHASRRKVVEVPAWARETLLRLASS